MNSPRVAALLAHPQKLFTFAAQEHSNKSDLKRVTIGLGGKSPNDVFAAADLETAIPGAAHAIFFNHGQCCAAGSQLYIEHKVYDDVLAGVLRPRRAALA